MVTCQLYLFIYIIESVISDYNEINHKVHNSSPSLASKLVSATEPEDTVQEIF